MESKNIITIPACSEHGAMILRPLSRQTYEQRWCGVWYDCPECGRSTLFYSRELSEQYRKAGIYIRPPYGHTEVFQEHSNDR